jgi:hypothetical protein
MFKEAVLTRDTQYFKVPKIITTDMAVLSRLINDLFPSIFLKNS